MTFREIRDHKFKILFMYNFLKTDIDQILLNYFENVPYEEESDDNSYVKDVSKAHKNIAKVKLYDDKNKLENVSDVVDIITLNEEDNISDITLKVKDIVSKTEEIDKIISENLETWNIKRVGIAELTIIRLAIYEMYYDKSIDIPIAINEAIELAKVYGDNKTPKFVNGVLATIHKKKN